jgi:hypothetical protein
LWQILLQNSFEADHEGFAVDASLIQADANKQRSVAGQDWRSDRDPARSSRAVKEYLTTLDDTEWGAASDVGPKFVSPSDPAAQWTGAHSSLIPTTISST